jgi:hypothetical protein
MRLCVLGAIALFAACGDDEVAAGEGGGGEGGHPLDGVVDGGKRTLCDSDEEAARVPPDRCVTDLVAPTELAGGNDEGLEWSLQVGDTACGRVAVLIHTGGGGLAVRAGQAEVACASREDGRRVCPFFPLEPDVSVTLSACEVACGNPVTLIQLRRGEQTVRRYSIQC